MISYQIVLLLVNQSLPYMSKPMCALRRIFTTYVGNSHPTWSAYTLRDDLVLYAKHPTQRSLNTLRETLTSYVILPT